MIVMSAIHIAVYTSALYTLHFSADHNGNYAASSGHLSLIHTLQQQDAEDAWLHLEWAEILIVLGRGSEAGRHYQARDHIETNLSLLLQPNC